MFSCHTKGGGVQICLHVHEIIPDEYTEKLHRSEAVEAKRETLLFILCLSVLFGYLH